METLDSDRGRYMTETAVREHAENSLRGISICYGLNREFRCVVTRYEKILDYIRCWMPKQHVLDFFQRKTILCSGDTPSDEQLWNAVVGNTSQTVVTVSREAAGQNRELGLKQCGHQFLHV